jgi:hypothetical protein
MSEAEDLVAELWLRLERYDLQTPGIRLESRSDGMVSLLLSFPTPEAAGLALGWTDFRTDRKPDVAAAARAQGYADLPAS